MQIKQRTAKLPETDNWQRRPNCTKKTNAPRSKKILEIAKEQGRDYEGGKLFSKYSPTCFPKGKNSYRDFAYA